MNIAMYDNANSVNVQVLHWYPPTWQQQYAISVPGVYAVAPATANCFVAVRWLTDNSVHIQTLNNLTAQGTIT